MSEKLNVKLLPEPAVRRDFIPASDYSEEFHRLEMERVWPRVWQVACREEEIPNVGDYVNYEIGNESILIVRDAPGSIKAFYNVCTHRGRRLRDDERGTVKNFFCRYHAWTFNLEGQVVSIPEEGDWKGCPQFSGDDLSIPRVKADTWAGWVWINMNPDCEPLREFLAPLPEKVDAFEWEQCRIRSYQTIIFPVNWKVALEAFVEAYHVRATHPQLNRYGAQYTPGLEEYYGPGKRHGAHTGKYVHEDISPKSEFKDAREYVHAHIMEIYSTLHGIFHEDGARAAQRVLTEVPAGVSKDEAYAYFAKFQREEMEKSGVAFPKNLTREHFAATEYQVFPNCSILPSPEGAFWYRSRPNGDRADSCIFDIWSLGRYAPGTEPKIKHEFYDSPEAFKGNNPILEQDFSNMFAVQKGMRSRGFNAARTNPIQESNVSNIHRVLHEYIFGSEA